LAYPAELAREGILNLPPKKSLKFKVDENLPPEYAAILREAGHDEDPRANLSRTGALLESAPVLLRAPVLGLEN
jgi:hypothetical protein